MFYQIKVNLICNDYMPFAGGLARSLGKRIGKLPQKQVYLQAILRPF